MKKITYLAISFIFLIYISACAGYKPIFNSSSLPFEIVEHSIKGDKKSGSKIYSKLYRLFKTNSDSKKKGININIETSKEKNATVKNDGGKILEYKIILKTNIILQNFLTKEIILNYNTTMFSSYKVQDLYSESLQKEKQVIDNLINNTYQDLLIKISELK